MFAVWFWFIAHFDSLTFSDTGQYTDVWIEEEKEKPDPELCHWNYLGKEIWETHCTYSIGFLRMWLAGQLFSFIFFPS